MYYLQSHPTFGIKNPLKTARLCTMCPHVFIAMPYGVKEGIDFNAVYHDFIKPAVEVGGFEPFRADEEQKAGDIKTDMFQELLLADLVIADLTLDNPNVWYELGIRHALRARGVVLIQSQRDYQPFDVYTDRKLRYHVKDGVPDPEHVEEDKKNLAEMLKATAASWHGHKASPVYHLLRGLNEPSWRTLLLTEHNAMRDAYETWLQRIEVARKENRPGDILLLAEEMPTYALRLEAKRSAGQALLRLREYELALEQFEAALALDPEDLVSRQQKGVCLRRLSRRAEAEEWIRDIVRDHPKDPESLALLGRLAKEDWLARWEQSGSNPNALTTRAARFQPLLHEAIERYRDAFQADLHHYYSAANAATLAELAEHLHVSRWTPDTRRQLRDAAVWSCLAALARNPHDHWARASLAELGLIAANDEKYLESYQHAVVAAAGDWFALDSIRQSLAMLSALGFLPDRVGPAMELVDEELSRASRPPRHVFLFTGHMIDKPDRLNPRFAPDKEPLVAEAIATKLDELGAGPEDIAVCSAACGGDILFAEKALDRGVRLQVHLPFPEADFLRASVSFAGENWTRRFYAVREQKLTSTRVLPRELGPGPEHSNAYSRNSVWQLFNALAMGADRVRFIYFWDGQEGDGPGGVRSTLRTVEHYLGRTYRLDPADIYGARNQ